MRSDWRELPFGELLAGGLRNGLTKPKKVRGEGVRMVNMGELFRYPRIADQEMDRVPLTANERKTSMLHNGDLLFARQSLVEAGTGQCSLVLPASEPRTFESHLIRARPDLSKAAAEYLFYFFRSPAGRSLVRSIVTQTGASGIKGTDLARLPVYLPEVPEQRRIAGVLASLDDKIEFNDRLAQRLGSGTRLAFSHHFPVIAGTIPLRDHVAVIRGRSYKSEELADGRVALVTLKSIQRGGGYAAHGLKPYVGDFKTEQVISPGEIVVAHTDLTQSADVIGKPAIVSASQDYDQLVASLDLAIVRPISPQVSRLFLYHVFLSSPFQQHAYGYANGSTVLHLNKNAVPSFEIMLPSEESLTAFERLARPFVDRALVSERESGRLACLRDTLLPKLVSGAIRVPASYDPDDVLGTVAEAAGVEV